MNEDTMSAEERIDNPDTRTWEEAEADMKAGATGATCSTAVPVLPDYSAWTFENPFTEDEN